MTKKKLSELELKIKKVGKAARKYADDKVVAAGLKKYTKGTPNTGYLQTIILSTAATQQAAEADANRIEIDIPKDLLLKSSKLLTVEAGTGANVGKWMVTKENNVAVAESYEAPAAVTGAGQWIDLVVNTVAGDETAQHICVDLTSFLDVYSNGNGLDLNNKVFSIKLNATASGLEVDSNGLKVKIGTNANGLSVTANGLELALATTSAAGAMSAADKTKLNKALTEDNIALLSDAEIGSWFGYDATESATILGGVSDDSITDDE